MRQVFSILGLLLGLKDRNKTNLPKRNKEPTLTYRSGITCLVCNTKNVDITEQGLCESCGSVIM